MATATTTRKTTPKTTPKTTASIDKNGGTVSGRFTLRNLPSFDVSEAASKPLFAVVGVADLAIEQAKDVPAQVRTLPSSVKSLRSDVEVRVDKANKKASDVYGKLTKRGERLVTQIRRQPATQEAIAEGKQAVRKAEASATAAKKTVSAGEKAVEDATGKLG
jgi:ElaB/YqjD/DUF883 family membrane-anchored ribosome-binding protein